MRRLIGALLLLLPVLPICATPVSAQETFDSFFRAYQVGDLRLAPGNIHGAPLPDANGVTVDTSLTWSSFGALTSDVYLAPYAGSTCAPVLVASGITNGTYLPVQFAKGTRYCWQVITHNGAGDTTSPIWTFTSEAPPPLVLTCPASLSVSSPDGNPVAVSYPAPQAQGGVPPVSVSAVPASGSLFAVGVTSVLGSAASTDGQTAGCSFSVTVTAPVPPPPPPPPSGGAWNDYFTALLVRSDFWKAYPLRTQSELLSLREGMGKAAAVNYVWPNDPDARKQDAAKVIIPAGAFSLPNQLRLPAGTVDGHAYLFTWDAWFGSEMRFAATAIQNYKTFQFDSPRVPGGVATIWFEINNRWKQAPNDAGMLTGRYYGTSTTPAGPGITAWDPVAPQLAPFLIKAETWTRYWVLLEQKTNGDAYTRASLWVADETRGPVKILDRLAFTVLGGVQRFWIEYNTSTEVAAPSFARVSYVRNVVMLRDVQDVPSLLQRPVK